MRTLPVECRYRVMALSGDGLVGGRHEQRRDRRGARRQFVLDGFDQAIARIGQPLEPKSRANKRQSLAQREGNRIRARIAEHPGTTLEDLKRDLNLEASISNIWYALRTLGRAFAAQSYASQRSPRTRTR